MLLYEEKFRHSDTVLRSWQKSKATMKLLREALFCHLIQVDLFMYWTFLYSYWPCLSLHVNNSLHQSHFEYFVYFYMFCNIIEATGDLRGYLLLHCTEINLLMNHWSTKKSWYLLKCVVKATSDLQIATKTTKTRTSRLTLELETKQTW